MKIVIASCLFFLVYEFSFSQNVNLRLERLTIKEGLLDYDIKSIIQDKNGFLWIGGANGLQKFDGMYFSNFQSKTTDTTSISSNDIKCIFEDSKGLIWIGTSSGLNCFLREKNIFVRFNKYKLENANGLEITSITEDQSGNIWFGTSGGGLYKINPSSNLFTLYTYDKLKKNSISSNYVSAVLYDPKTKSIYAGTRTGINIFDFSTNGFANPNNPSLNWPECSLLGSGFITNLQMEDTAIWVSDIAGNFYLYHRKNNKIDTLNGKLNYASGKTYDKYYVVCEGGNLWFSSYIEGLRRLELTTGKVSPLFIGTLNSVVSPVEQCNFIFKDRNETLWISTNEGLNYFSLKRSFFDVIPINNPKGNNEHAELHCVYTSNGTDIWLGSHGTGLYNYKINNGITETLVGKPGDILYGETIYEIIQTEPNVVWLGTSVGLLKFDPSKKSFEKYDLTYQNSEGIQRHHVLHIFNDHKDTLWIMTWDGPLLIFDKSHKKFIEAHTIQGLDELKKMPRINSIIEDYKSRLWFGSAIKGLFCYSRSDGNHFQYLNQKNNPASLSSDRINKIYEASNHTIWIGTWDNYLNKYNEDQNNFSRCGEQMGIPDVNIQTIIEDNEKNLLLGTTKGLCLFNLKNLSVRTFDIFDGLPENWISKDLIGLDGNSKFIFSSSNSLVIFEPEHFKQQKLSSPVTITNIKLFDKFLTNAEAVANDAIIDLKPIDNFISIEFVALDFLHPNKIKYSYKLSGFNNDWIDNGDKRSVSFSNLAGGSYTFMVKCINADGIWSKPATINIIKHPAFSQTVWFRLLMSALIVAIIITYVRLRVMGLRKQKVQLEKMVSLRTQQYKAEAERAERSEKYKEEFLANMSHEIRTPMNAVVGLSNLLISTPLNEKQKNYLNAIRESSVNLMVILNDILDLSKIEAGKIEFEEIDFNLRKVLKNVEDVLRLKSDEKSLFLKSEIQAGIPLNLTGDPTRLNQILMNLAGNAIKFTAYGGVTISIEKIAETSQKIELLFKVMDTGIGISVDNIEKIFESFTQEKVETTRKFGGTGLGLSISKKLVELQGGKIGVKSVEGKGSEFYFNITYKIASDNDSKIAAAVPDIHPLVFNGLNVLIVEDNEFNQLVAKDTLVEFNKKINVDIAENGKVALSKVSNKKYDVILMDIQMPDMDGYMVTKQIRNTPECINCKTPIVAMTANASKMEIEKCLAASMNEYISKPFDPANLFVKISKVLSE